MFGIDTDSIIKAMENMASIIGKEIREGLKEGAEILGKEINKDKEEEEGVFLDHAGNKWKVYQPPQFTGKCPE